MATNETLTGTVETVIYQNPANDYAVIELVTDVGELVTAVGILPFVAEGENLHLHGKWGHHPDYGQQFTVESFEKFLPTGCDDILRYLSSRVVKGIGPVTALKIVNRFKEDSFDVIENHPEWLADIPGISMKKAREISVSFSEQNGMRTLIMLAGEYFSTPTLVRIYKQWGSEALTRLQENPYDLCRFFHGITFERADAMALSLGGAMDSYKRIVSGMQYVLHYNAQNNGHVCLPCDKLIESAAATLTVEKDTVEDALLRALDEKKLYMEKQGDLRLVYLPEMLDAESYVASKLHLLADHCAVFSREDVERSIERTELEYGMHYAELQRAAIFEAMRGGVMVLTGGPGTGKTTVIRALYTIFTDMGMEVALCAPTGRAAKRMSEATANKACTVHRLLEMERSDTVTPVFGRNEKNPLEEDVLIVDEASMLDLPLVDALLRAMRRGTRLILIGDTDQLPAVGAGNVLGDIVAAGAFPTVRLTEIFRQADGSRIVTNAHRINRGQAPEYNADGGDFFFVGAEEAHIPDTVADLISRRLPNAYGEEIEQKIQVITPSRRGSAGTENLNRVLQRTLNPKHPRKKEILFRDAVFREGDRVMQIRNNYDIEWKKKGKDGDGRGIFNGDIGILRSINEKEETMTIVFDDRVAEYEFSLLEELEHAYAITVHKSQGSEYPVILFPSHFCPPMLMSRNLLYTAVTRAREMVILVGRRDAVDRMLANNREVLRYTGLCARLNKNI